jgi:CDP-diacylglycerol--glycerol-3-phosphate 3-phosphatidyltransferase
MPSLYQLKPAFQRSLLGLVQWLALRRVTANQVTLVAAFTSIGYGLALASFPQVALLWLALPLFLLIRMALNAVDGMLARQFHQVTPLGGLLNELGDVISDAALYLPFACVAGVSPWLVVLAVLLSWLTEFVGVCAVMVGASRRYDGPMGKSDRAFVFGALSIAVGCGYPGAGALNAGLALVAILSVMTVLHRGARAIREATAR